jgi:isopenicillin N synthase-like dioxygenase
LLKFHTGHENELSLRHYPPVSAAMIEKQQMRRLSSHTDFDSFTLLFQDDCGGLEVEKMGEPGVYLPVEPIEGALVMNIGDALMRWSNGTETFLIFFSCALKRETMP